MTLLYWDHLLTLTDEIQYMWKRPVRTSTVLFFFSRYLAVAENIVVAIYFFSDLPESSCQRFEIFHQLLLIATLILVGLLLTIRVYALYHCSKHVLAVLLSIASILTALSIFSTSFRQKQLKETFGCHPGLSFITSVQFAVTWEAMFLYDVVLFAMTLHRAYKTRHELHELRQLRISLFVIILRDGSLYFGVTAFVNAINISTFYYPLPYVRGTLSTLVTSVSVTAMSRLILHLHEIADSGLYTSHLTTIQFGTNKLSTASPPGSPL
ncbi:hypothetical protein GYMLUDRAFT_47529, partial [Collybiopsis luxurians FD-317 M1]